MNKIYKIKNIKCQQKQIYMRIQKMTTLKLALMEIYKPMRVLNIYKNYMKETSLSTKTL